MLHATSRVRSLARGWRHETRFNVLDSRCRACRCVFNAFTGTALQGTKRRPVALLLILRGFAQGVSTARLARELGCDRLELLRFRHKLQDLAYRFRDVGPLEDPVVEADEVYQNAGEKGAPHRDPSDPPRRRANKRRGHGTYANDRPPVCGVVGPTSGKVKLTVVGNSDGPTLERVVREATSAPGSKLRSHCVISSGTPVGMTQGGGSLTAEHPGLYSRDLPPGLVLHIPASWGSLPVERGTQRAANPAILLADGDFVLFLKAFRSNDSAVGRFGQWNTSPAGDLTSFQDGPRLYVHEGSKSDQLDPR